MSLTSRNSERPFPTFVYKIVETTPPPIDNNLPHILPLSDLDRKDGFIHLSSATQIPITAELFFKDHANLWVLQIDSKQAQSDGGELRWVEGEGLEGCVHLHEGRLGKGVVVAANEYERRPDEVWGDTFRRIWLRGK